MEPKVAMLKITVYAYLPPSQINEPRHVGPLTYRLECIHLAPFANHDVAATILRGAARELESGEPACTVHEVQK